MKYGNTSSAVMKFSLAVDTHIINHIKLYTYYRLLILCLTHTYENNEWQLDISIGVVKGIQLKVLNYIVRHRKKYHTKNGHN